MAMPWEDDFTPASRTELSAATCSDVRAST